MKIASVIVALAALAFAVPEKMNKRQNSVDPASATASLLAVLPSSILNVAITNQAEATTLIEEAFATGTPAWFTSLPTAVQSYFLSQVGAGAATTTAGTITSGASVPLSTGSSGNSSAASTGKFTNSTTTATGSKTSSSSSGSSSSRASAASSSSSSGAAAVPTAVIGGGLAGVIGLLGMLAL